jgi:hypothetical protein
VGRVTFKKGSILRAVAMPSHSPHASRPSTFRAPGWGAPALPSSCCRWRSATLRELAPFSHRSALRIFIMQPGCIPSPLVIEDDDHQFGGGEKQVGLRPLPRPQLQGSSSSGLGRRGGELGPTSVWAGDPLLPPTFRGGRHPPALRRRHPPAMRGKANCCCRDRVQLSVLHPGRQSCRVRAGHVQVLPALSAAQHVVRREGGTRVLGRSHSRSRGENGSEDLPVRFGAAAARWHGVGGQVAAVVGAEVVVAIGEASPCRSGCLCGRDRQCHLRSGPPALWL